MANNIQNPVYETPVLRVHGTLEMMTHGASTGSVLDASFPRGTPVEDITFS
ncbi:hypothetical protein LAZ40_15005 [Cereibacter sphaeroides]|uniref:hypothetical protein n=1 Tax=Rhodobacterales TaxID=204455 RepID=UPI0018E080CB|nr:MULTISPECIES: hypothetical protein [Paracoccaceae]MCE6953350.1 hypothetical protein [Cereibacter sphaeroides]MCE6960331.1 hypothetical protein [Cereibacter sphaeroides]MCE6969280.1 hypothetical protein [Cereibacter sphaeroides]MCE6975339.1 hypothetical protein [Cereibacter sphaeroides]